MVNEAYLAEITKRISLFSYARLAYFGAAEFKNTASGIS